MTTRVVAADLLDFAAGVLAAHGLRSEHAREVAEVLVWADLRGVDSHGVSRLPLYCGWLRSGEMNKDAQVRPALELPALCVLEGDRCPGPVGMGEASRRAVALARASGVGAVLLRHATHTGALGFYTSAVARDGVAGLAMVASGPLMGYFGAAGPAVSTAPISIAAPRAGGQPLVFDMASSAIPVGRLLLARQQGQALPPGSAMDAAGLPTQDPGAAIAPLPLAGPKGSGLALMAEVLCSLLAGAPVLVPAANAAGGKAPHTQNALVVAFDTRALNGPSGLGDAVETLAALIHGLPVAKDAQQVLLPGERGWRELEQRTAAGIPLSPKLALALATLAADAGIHAPWL
jgi:LDH2 family malate/lactate/ureidoglycolate dehydrogenase